MRRLLTPLALAVMMVGCGTMRSLTNWNKPSTTDRVVNAIVPAQESFNILSGVGGICLLAGMVLLVVSRGTMGWRPVIGGVALVLLNYMVCEYADWIFIPVVVATGCISAAWGWKVVENIFKQKKENGNG